MATAAPVSPVTSAAPKATDVAAVAAQLSNLEQNLKALLSQSDSARANLPAVRKGESVLTSRGYSFLKLFQVMSGKLTKEEAKVEIGLHNELQKRLHDDYGYVKAEANSIMAPMGSELLPCVSDSERAFCAEVRDVVKAGVRGFDPREVVEIRRKLMGGARQKTLSWTDETALGSLVEPPLMGELIEVLRNNEIFMAAGAQTIGLPPNGRLVYPRQTGASTAYYIGENQQIPSSQPQTGDITLQAKKVACLIQVPNELFRYASVSVEMFLRQDMTKVLGLRMDKELLEGKGSSNSPKGIINYANISQYTSIGTPADGNSGYPLQPEDVYKMIATVEEQNAIFRAWVMRPSEFAYIVNRRADAVTTGDGKGPYMFNVWREVGERFDLERTQVGNLSGYPVHKSTQMSNTRTRGSGTTNNTYILGGDFTDYIVAVAPTIEFAMTQQGDTAFQNDQTWLRAILPHDGAPRHEAAYVFADNLLY